jgi:hypothetical protein
MWLLIMLIYYLFWSCWQSLIPGSTTQRLYGFGQLPVNRNTHLNYPKVGIGKHLK